MRVRAETWSAALGALAVIAGITSLCAGRDPALVPGPATVAAPPVESESATLPGLGDLAHYDVNDADPFVPLAARLAEMSHQPQPSRPPGGGVIPPSPPSAHPAPPLVLPEVRVSQADFACVGVVAAHRGQTLLVRLPTGTTAAIAVGEAVTSGDGARRWVLEALEPGGIARFRDPLGAAQRLAVGGSAALAPERRL